MTARLAIALLIAHFAGNLLIFTTPPFEGSAHVPFALESLQVCIGWPDDNVPSWICTPDYTAREVP